MITEKLSNQVLTIGSKFEPPKGGIEMVLKTYSDFIPNFNFLSTWKKTSKINTIIYFIIQIPKIVYELITNKDIRIIHLHGSYNGSLIRKFIILHLVKIISSQKVIYHSHGSKFEMSYFKANKLKKLIIRRLIENSDAIICLSQSWKVFFESNFKVKKVFVLNNIVKKPKHTSPNIKKDNDVIKFLFLGFISERKGIYDLLNCVRDNHKEFRSKIEIHIGGNGEAAKLEKIILESNLGDIVKFHGWVSGSKKEELLNFCDVFILPSYNEGLPIAILEAMSYKKPIISTKVGGIPEIVTNLENGLLISAGNLIEMKNSIIYFIQNRNSISSFGNASGKIASEYFPDKVLDNLRNIYSEILTS